MINNEGKMYYITKVKLLNITHPHTIKEHGEHFSSSYGHLCLLQANVVNVVEAKLKSKKV